MINEEKTIENSSGGTDRRLELMLFVSGSQNSQQMLDRLNRIIGEHFSDSFDIELVNILDEPEKAYRYDVIATPTLIRLKPEPVRRVIGDITHAAEVFSALGLSP